MPKLTLEAFKSTEEYRMWIHIEQLCEQYELTGDNYIVRKDIGGVFWEPLWDRLFKFGLMLKHVPKSIKYIKGEWMRPLLYLESQSNDIVIFDGVQYKINKTANSAAINLRIALRNLLNSLVIASKMTDESFNDDYKHLKEDDKYFFKMLNAYVKEGYRPMHENLKDILLPLRLLRKGGYRLFSYEERINKNVDLNMFNDKEQLKSFIKAIGEEFKNDELLQAKTNTPEELDKIMKRETKDVILKYNYNEEKLKEEKKENQQNPYDSIALKTNKNTTTVRTAKKANELAKKNYELQQKAIKEREEQKLRLLIYPNLEILTQPKIMIFERDALVADFEKGFKAMLVYLNNKFPLQIPEIVDPHKLTVNLDNIPKNRHETNFYLKQLEKCLYDLKKMCYEMKLNGINRILLPITANIEFTTQVKMVYDLHVLIDRIMGDKLKLEQYSFIYNEIDYISKSNFHEELFYFKDKNFMEIGVSKYIFYQALCHSVDVLIKMRKNNRLHGIKYDSIENYFQTTQLSLDSMNEFNSFNYYNFDNYVAEATKIYSTELKKQIALDKITLKHEMKTIGRFFILENFIDPEEKANWIELAQLLIEINSAVREDIKDHLLRSTSNRMIPSLENESKNSSKNLSKKTSKNVSRNTSRKPTDKHKEGANINNIQNVNRKPKKLATNSSSVSISTNKKLNKMPTKKFDNKKKKKEMSMDNIMEDSTKNLNNIFKEIKISRFKPPFIWHFPLEKIRELQKKNNNYEIGTKSVDFKQIYKDGRVDIFLDKFEAMFNKNMKYCKEKLNNNWEYMLCKQYEIFDIKYQPFIDKCFRKIDLKPPEPKEEDEGDNLNGEEKNVDNIENKGGYNDEIIHTEIDLEH